MVDTTFTGGTPILASWLNDVNDVVYGMPNISDATKGAGQVGYKQSLSYTSGTVGYKLQESVSLDDFEGATDHAKFTAALTFCNVTGRALKLPARLINIDTDLGSLVLEEVSIYGEGVLDGANATLDAGSIIQITGTTNTPFKIRRGVVIEGVNFYYPNQTDSATPTVYPVLFDFDFSAGAVQFVYIRNNVIFNAYRFIDITDATGAVGHIWIENNTVCALNRGIYTAHNAEHIRINGNNFTFGHWLASTEAGARSYVRTNCVYILTDKSDGIEVFDNLFFGSLIAWSLGTTGNCNSMSFVKNEVDQCRYGVRGTGSGNVSIQTGLNSFSCWNSEDTTLQGISIFINTTGSDPEYIMIGPEYFGKATEAHIQISGNNPIRDVTICASQFLSWAAHKTSSIYYAANINGSQTKVTISGSRFYGANNPTYSGGISGTLAAVDVIGSSFITMQTPISVTTTTSTFVGNTATTTGGSITDNINATTLTMAANNFDKPNFPMLVFPIAKVENYANDAAAAIGNIEVGGLYRNGSVLMIRVT